MKGRLAFPALIAVLVAVSGPASVVAQEPVEEPVLDPVDESALEPDEEPEEDPAFDPDEETQEVPEPPLPSPTERSAPEEDPAIRQLEEEMAPTLVLPEFRVRVGGGVGIQTSGASNILGRVTQEIEWQPPPLQFLLFGIGGAQAVGPAGVIWQVGARVGGHAWFCEDSLVRCQGAITLQLGYIGGALGSAFDFSADADLRFLFAKVIEVFVRGGFFSVGTSSFTNVTAGVAVAF